MLRGPGVVSQCQGREHFQLIETASQIQDLVRSRLEGRNALVRPFGEPARPGGAMHQGKLVFAQVRTCSTSRLPPFAVALRATAGERKVKTFSSLDQYLCVSFAQSLNATARCGYADEPLGVVKRCFAA